MLDPGFALVGTIGVEAEGKDKKLPLPLVFREPVVKGNTGTAQAILLFGTVA